VTERQGGDDADATAALIGVLAFREWGWPRGWACVGDLDVKESMSVGLGHGQA
jgi:hypothetical protein